MGTVLVCPLDVMCRYSLSAGHSSPPAGRVIRYHLPATDESSPAVYRCLTRPDRRRGFPADADQTSEFEEPIYRHLDEQAK